jgi:hypothetical protein
MNKRMVEEEVRVVDFYSGLDVDLVIQKLQELRDKYPNGSVSRDLNYLTYVYEREETTIEARERDRLEKVNRFFELKDHLENLEKFGTRPNDIRREMNRIALDPNVQLHDYTGLYDDYKHLWEDSE